MLAAGACPNGHTFPSILRFASASGPDTRALHAQCLRCGLTADRFIVCSLVSSYGRAVRLGCDASKVFDEMANPDLVSSNAMLDVLCLAGDVAAAREFFERMVVWDVVSWTMLIFGYPGMGATGMLLRPSGDFCWTTSGGSGRPHWSACSRLVQTWMVPGGLRSGRLFMRMFFGMRLTLQRSWERR
ncbi:putative pentatricopeptide repeat-containing protein [Hordeum vulgare]|nr:putative pentatricopeptide repeat-containing protein [Hordeum vulgare]